MIVAVRITVYYYACKNSLKVKNGHYFVSFRWFGLIPQVFWYFFDDNLHPQNVSPGLNWKRKL